ncbi:MAG: hypothetical protein QCI00_04655 [Candidatus Thermoplasmatota archaeon]|nr:hypothetical protein [Candidatus Thermoplasmatota archaeon]
MRKKKIINDILTRYSLDLSGLTILTEAATGDYAYTSVMAALAGADKVYAIAKDSKYGTKLDIKESLLQIYKDCNINTIEVIEKPEKKYVEKCDIITNSGFVRPINNEMIDCMKETAVIPLMFETWEFRSSDIDIQHCIKKQIPVLGTNERCNIINLFKGNGLLATKVLFEAGCEVFGNKILIIGSGLIGQYVQDYFDRNEIDNIRITFDKREQNNEKNIIYSDGQTIFESFIFTPDAILICEHVYNIPIISQFGIINCNTFHLLRDTIICHICGSIDNRYILNNGISIYPKDPAPFGYMSFHIGYLGPMHVLDLNCAGLKVGEIMARLRMSGLSYDDTITEACKNELVMSFGEDYVE